MGKRARTASERVGAVNRLETTMGQGFAGAALKMRWEDTPPVSLPQKTHQVCGTVPHCWVGNSKFCL
jgi:hypothetical protein